MLDYDFLYWIYCGYKDTVVGLPFISQLLLTIHSSHPSEITEMYDNEINETQLFRVPDLFNVCVCLRNIHV